MLTTLAALGDTIAGHGNGHGAGAAVIALTLSMGAAEWLLYRCRGRALTALAATTRPAALLLRAARVLAGCVAGYLAALTALTLATGALWPDGPSPTVPRVAALLSLGAVLWTGLLLQGLRHRLDPRTALPGRRRGRVRRARAAGSAPRPPANS
ncbi:hypothetical protein GCM10020000_72050 [Streptomyces olivoverticillatus]